MENKKKKKKKYPRSDIRHWDDRVYKPGFKSETGDAKTTSHYHVKIQAHGEQSKLVNARVPLDLVEERYNQWKIGGYVIANRYKHDSSVETPLGVQLEEGHWHKTGGTTTEPRVTGDKGRPLRL